MVSARVTPSNVIKCELSLSKMALLNESTLRSAYRIAILRT